MNLDQNFKTELANARKYADQGRVSTMESCLSLAQTYAQRIGQDVSAQVAEIRAWLKK